MITRVAIAIILTLGSMPMYAAKEGHAPGSGKKQIHSIVLMPIEVSLTKVSMKGAESMMEEASDAQLPLTLELQAALHDLGYQLDFQALATDVVARNSEERYTVDDLQKKFDAQLSVMRHKSKDIRKGRFTLTDEVLQLPLSESVDALLFVRVHGQVLTQNRKAFGTFVAGPRNDFVLLEFSLVDAKNGEVLFLARASVLASLSQDPEEVATGIARAFAGLPKVAPPLQVTPKSNEAFLQDASLEKETAADQSAPIRRLPLSHVVVKSLLVKKVAPKYPGIAISSHVHGDVVLRIVIDRMGKVSEVKVESGAVQLIPAATTAVKQWRYRPLTLNGQIFEVETQITETFQMDP